jgi:hypothetical protein
MTADLANRAERAVADFEHAAGFLKGPYFEEIVTRAVRESITAAHSPWVDRQQAAAHCRCSLSELDRAAAKGFIKRFERGGTPLFSKSDLNTAIASGRWRPHKK